MQETLKSGLLRVRNFLAGSVIWIKIVFYILLFLGVALLVISLRGKALGLVSWLRKLIGADQTQPVSGDASAQRIEKKVISNIPEGVGDHTATSKKVIDNIDSLLAELAEAKK